MGSRRAGPKSQRLSKFSPPVRNRQAEIVAMHVREGNWDAAHQAIDCAEFSDWHSTNNGDTEDVAIAEILDIREAHYLEKMEIIWAHEVPKVTLDEFALTRGVGLMAAKKVEKALNRMGYKFKQV